MSGAPALLRDHIGAISTETIVQGLCECVQVYEAFEEHLSHCGLVHTVTPISPSEGYHGLGNKEDIYEDGYRMYCVNHR